jgi:hypothetical protein
VGVDIATYRDRIGLFGRRKSSVTSSGESVSKVGITKMWFMGLIIASLLIVGGVELNPGPTLEDKVMEILTGQRENVKIANDWMEKNKTSLDNT